MRNSFAMLTYFEATVIGAVQGVTELFPISSLGHSVLVAAWLGGAWRELPQGGESSAGTPYLAFVVALHVATAFALLAHYRRDWYAITTGFAVSLRTRRVETVPQRMAWLIVLGSIPVGVLGPLLQHPLHELFSAPLAAAVFLTLNGVILVLGEVLRRRNEPTLVEYGRRFARWETRRAAFTTAELPRLQADRPLAALTPTDALGIGLVQAGALLTGFSRAGLAMVGGLWRGLEHEHAAKFAFLLATPAILGAGLLDLHDLPGPGSGDIGPILLGALVSGVSSWLAVRYLERHFQTRTLLVFALYCLVAGALSILRFS
ncbi:undecaprenyl-diphosphate phosphatase [Nocardia sp. NBC_01503]|uniref:undecaprenyl-diphosphate phosphatase n=1 Tax=Nocardia sp. NBC_01503 TaxID=2975997 RepID=UPI002E7C17D8|nr:undecaprenyl-diphosphate phosphatase [Nocardia sp. NBC_01503]WTL29189.1 undecaprenyl-diphosphate phosphatase [Nocardia sp. NBC_01503]